jgi:hypothetical protein
MRRASQASRPSDSRCRVDAQICSPRRYRIPWWLLRKASEIRHRSVEKRREGSDRGWRRDRR